MIGTDVNAKRLEREVDAALAKHVGPGLEPGR